MVFLVLGDFVILDFDESGAFKLFTKALASIQLVSKTSMGLLTWTDCKIAVAPIDEHENLALVHWLVRDARRFAAQDSKLAAFAIELEPARTLRA